MLLYPDMANLLVLKHFYLSNTINQVLRHTNHGLGSLIKCPAVSHLIISNHPSVSSQCSEAGFRLHISWLYIALEEASLEPFQQGLNLNRVLKSPQVPVLQYDFNKRRLRSFFQQFVQQHPLLSVQSTKQELRFSAKSLK